MKKLLLLGLFLLGSLSFSEGNIIETRLGYDLNVNSKIKTDDEENLKVLKNGIELGVEYRRELSSGFEIGGGIFYKKSGYKNTFKDGTPEGNPYGIAGSIDTIPLNVETKGFNSLPIYATARYKFYTPSEIKPYIKANLGYSFKSGSARFSYAENTNIWTTIKGRVEDEFKFRNGLYYSIGIGAEFKNFTVDLSYNVIRSKYDYYYMYDASSNLIGSGIETYNYANETGKVSNKFITLSFGYNFKF